MKRDNLMMPACIVVIILGIVVKLFWNYSMWGALVTAAACSSACFSIADFASSYAVDLRSAIQLDSNSSKDVLELCRHFQVVYTEKMIEVEKNSPNKDDIQAKNLKFLSMCRDLAADLAESSEKKRDNTVKKKGEIRRLEITYAAFTVLGFVLFFFFLIFPESQNILATKLDLISVSAFAVILFTQYLAGLMKEKHIKDVKKNEQFFDSMEKFFLCSAEGVYDHAD